MAGKSDYRGPGLDTTRAFVSIELPGEVKELISGHIERLKDVVAGRMKWVDPHIAHLTLAFLGNVPDARLPLLSHLVDDVGLDSTAFCLSTGQLGIFPNLCRPRVLWLGLEGDIELLLQLQRRLQNALSNKGFAIERRAFKPHVTLGRARGMVEIDEVALSIAGSNSLELPVRELAVVSSVLTPGGPIHTPVHRASLSAVSKAAVKDVGQG